MKGNWKPEYNLLRKVPTQVSELMDEAKRKMKRHYTYEEMEKAITRAGSCMQQIFQKIHFSDNLVLNAEDALKLYNTYGLPESVLLIICHSHNIRLAVDGLRKLIKKQDEELKNSILC